MPESVKTRSSSGPTIGAIVRSSVSSTLRCLGASVGRVAMQTGYAGRWAKGPAPRSAQDARIGVTSLSCGVEHRNVVTAHFRIASRDRQTLDTRLGDQDAIEGVAMVERQAGHGESMREPHGQLLKARALDQRRQVGRHLDSSQRLLDPHLPEAARADEY